MAHDFQPNAPNAFHFGSRAAAGDDNDGPDFDMMVPAGRRGRGMRGRRGGGRAGGGGGGDDDLDAAIEQSLQAVFSASSRPAQRQEESTIAAASAASSSSSSSVAATPQPQAAAGTPSGSTSAAPSSSAESASSASSSSASIVLLSATPLITLSNSIKREPCFRTQRADHAAGRWLSLVAILRHHSTAFPSTSLVYVHTRPQLIQPCRRSAS